jgi:hypothetical protein
MTQNKIIFFSILGGGAPGAPPALDPPLGVILSKDWLTRNQNKVFEWSEMSIRGLLFQ